MSIQVKRRREAASFLSSFVGAQAELIVDTTNNRVQVHDGATAGGWPAAKLAETQVIGRTTVNDSDYVALATDALVAFTALSAPRKVTLPASSAFAVGRILRILDETGAASAAASIQVAPAPGDAMEGASAVIEAPYGSLAFVSNGAGRWFRLDAQGASTLQNVSALGVNTAPDPANPLSATLNSVLLNALGTSNGGAGDVRLKLNKQDAAHTASILLQDNWSGRAEIGLTGDDHLRVKVSPDGSSWLGAVMIDAASGNVGIGGDAPSQALDVAGVIQTHAPNGSTMQFCITECLVALSGASTTAPVPIPANCILFSVSAYVVQAITGAASFSVGTPGNATQFGGSLGIAAGSSNFGLIGPNPLYADTPLIVSASNGSFTGGQVRLALHYMRLGGPTS